MLNVHYIVQYDYNLGLPFDNTVMPYFSHLGNKTSTDNTFRLRIWSYRIIFNEQMVFKKSSLDNNDAGLHKIWQNSFLKFIVSNIIHVTNSHNGHIWPYLLSSESGKAVKFGGTLFRISKKILSIYLIDLKSLLSLSIHIQVGV